jgi:hypothetical protein
VRLLLGEVPEREEFSAPGMRTALAPYFELTCAVRSGDLAQFRAVSEKFAGAFRADRTTNLITRLQYNVIRTGLRRINLAYSRISLKVRPSTGPGHGWWRMYCLSHACTCCGCFYWHQCDACCCWDALQQGIMRACC